MLPPSQMALSSRCEKIIRFVWYTPASLRQSFLHFSRNLPASPMPIVCLFVLPPFFGPGAAGRKHFPRDVECTSVLLGSLPFQSTPVHLGDAGVHWRCMRGFVRDCKSWHTQSLSPGSKVAEGAVALKCLSRICQYESIHIS